MLAVAAFIVCPPAAVKLATPADGTIRWHHL